MEVFVVLLHADHGDGRVTGLEEVFVTEDSAEKYVIAEGCNLYSYQWFEIETKELKE